MQKTERIIGEGRVKVADLVAVDSSIGQKNVTGLWRTSVPQSGLSNTRVTRIAIGHLQLL